MSTLNKSVSKERSSTPAVSSENISSIPLDQEDEESDFLYADLLQRMDIEGIQDLKNYFFNEEKIKESDPKHLQENLVHGLSLSKTEFIEAMENLSGSSLIAVEAAKLFDSLDVGEKGSLRWENILDAIIAKAEEPLGRECEGWEPIDRNVDIHYASHCKTSIIGDPDMIGESRSVPLVMKVKPILEQGSQELSLAAVSSTFTAPAFLSHNVDLWFALLEDALTNVVTNASPTAVLYKMGDLITRRPVQDEYEREYIVKVVPLYTKLTFCYAVVSQLGRVGVYDGEFNLLDTYKVALKPTLAREYLTGEQEERQRRSKTTWITDVVFVPDIYALFFSASNCSLHLYDATGLIHVPLCLISGLKNVPTCLEFYSSNDPDKPSILFFGDDEGDVTVMQFHQPKKTLFKKKDPDKMDKYLWSELKEQTDYVTYSVQRRVHNDIVLQISYSPENQTVLTCSNDPETTMVLRHLEKKRKPYIFKIPKGVKCFHLEKSLHIIVTGSRDGLVRIWNQVVTKQPIISLHGHSAPIVDIRVLKNTSAVISLSEKAIIKVWNINNYYCQMTLPLNFPVFKILGSKIDFGTRSIFPGPSVTNIFDESNAFIAKESSKVVSLTEEIETWLSTRDFEIREEEEWSRNSVIVICCNFIASLKLLPMPSYMKEDGAQEMLGKYKVLPPPAREHFASIPSPWKIADFFTRTPPEESEESSAGKSSNSSSISKSMPITKTFKKVQNMTADPVKAPMKNMNTKRTQFKIKQEQMKMLIEHCAPHLALDLHDLTPIKFSQPLPRTRRMIEKGIDVSDPEKLIKGKLLKESTVTTGETISDVPSLHSSKSSKLLGNKKITSPRKGRQTPDWFAEKIKSFQQDSSESSNESKK